MAKAKDDIVLENLGGFARLGAHGQSHGNVPTGHFALDFVIHNGETPDQVDLSKKTDYDPAKPLGIPRGKLVELFGEEGSGKSSLAYRIVGYAQKMSLPCAWIDTENSFADNLAIINGVDPNQLYYADMSNEKNPDKIFYAEDVFDAIVTMIKSGVKVIVLDSVANLVPKYRMEQSAEKQTVGLLARLMSENLGKIVNHAGAYGALVIFINQLREKIGIMFGNPETTPGGRSLKHNASLRIQISKKGGKDANIYRENEDGNEQLIGRIARVYVRKNKIAKPFLEALELPIYYEPYFPGIEEMLFDVGRQLKLISVRKGIYKWNPEKGDEHSVQGRKAFIDHIQAKSLQMELAIAAMNKAEETNVILPPEITQWYMQNESGEDKVVDNGEEVLDEGPTA